MAALSQALAHLVPLGLRVREDEIRTRLRLTDPGDDDDVLEARAPAAEPEPGAGPAPAARAAAELRQVITAIEADEWRSLAGPLIEPILARAADDPDGLLTDLGSAYPTLDAHALTERLARIIFVGDCWAKLEPDQ